MQKKITTIVKCVACIFILIIIFLPNVSAADYVDTLIGYEICITGVIFGGMALVFYFVYLAQGGEKAVEKEKQFHENIKKMQELQIKKLET